jgi:hypothetical protein
MERRHPRLGSSRIRAARLALTVILAAMPGLALVVGTSTTTFAGPPCYDTSCNYYDPQNNFSGVCANDAITVDYTWDNTYGYYVNLRWGNYCGANWARTFSAACSPGPYCDSGYYFESHKGSTTLTLNDWFSDYNSQPNHWSLMLSGASSTDRVCLYEDRSTCTAWH